MTWGLRDYGTGTWEGGDEGCDHTPALRDGATSGLGATADKKRAIREGYYGATCGKCGALRIDNQIGLEDTPDAYLARMVDVFREVRRVLAPHGTCWVNMGDGYAANRSYQVRDSISAKDHDFGGSNAMSVPDGLKPKDLIGMPWRLALALQAPYYTGKIKDERDRIWLAAIVEAEGCMFIHRRKAGQSNGQGYHRKNDNYGPGLEVSSTDRSIVQRCLDIAGVGSICEQTPEANHRRKQTIYRWNVRTLECRDVVRELYPHMVAKQHEARLLLGCPSSGEDARKAWQSLKNLHQGDQPCIDFQPPEGMWERGWFLRSEIIWAKCMPNPMPESVTDRPTKGHEQIFLLTKQARYFYDADAVREPHDDKAGGVERFGKIGSAGGYVESERTIQGGVRSTAIAKGDARVYNPAGRNRRTVWNIPTQPQREAHFACVDDQTEALTYSGWKRHEDLRDGEPIAMYDPATDSCRFSPATFHRYHFNGRLVAIEKRDTSQRLTPNHRCFVKRRSGWTGIVRADELVPGMEILTCAPIEVDEIEGVGERHASLLGWYTTEGSNHHDGYVSIYQSQSANPGHVATIRQLLSGVGATVKERTRTRDYRGRASIEVEFVVNGEVAYWLQACGKTLDPAAVRLPENEATALLDALIDGDGHRRKDGRSCIVQKDKTSIDRMQMLALRLGHRAVVSERKDGGHVLYLTRGRWLTLRGTNGQHVPIGREHYNGTVWCPKVATGLWLARRNGKPFITGNTFPERLPELCILAGCPPGGVVLDPFAGSGTTLHVARKHGRHSIGIELNPDYCELAARRLAQQSIFSLGGEL